MELTTRGSDMEVPTLAHPRADRLGVYHNGNIVFLFYAIYEELPQPPHTADRFSLQQSDVAAQGKDDGRLSAIAGPNALRPIGVRR